MKKQIVVFVSLLSAGALLSCQSGRGPEVEAKKSQVVEAYLEFGGPAQKWVGPGSWIVHVTAKQGPVEVNVAMESPLPAGYPATTARSIASSEPKDAKHETPAAPAAAEPAVLAKVLPFDDVRAQLSGLAVQMAEDEEEATACLNRVHVKLIREDGTTIEKEGCRNAKGWTGRVSALAAEWAR